MQLRLDGVTPSQILPLVAALLTTFASTAAAQEVTFGPGGTHQHSRPDDHAPIGVMQDHLHGKGEWMVSYRTMRMDMEGSRNGTDRVSDGSVVDPAGFGFLVTPTQMTMEMHMVGAMYAPSDTVTLAAMVPYIEFDMDHITRAGGSFRTQSSGVGDVSLAALVALAEGETTRLHANLGVTVPTGSIDERDVIPATAPNDAQLPYPMQLGSGTWDLRPGLTLVGLEDEWSWGAQALATVRLGRNDREYSLGDRIDVTAWAARQVTSNVSVSGRLALE